MPTCFCVCVCKAGVVQKTGLPSLQYRQGKGMHTQNLQVPEVLGVLRAHRILEAGEPCYASLPHNTTVLLQDCVELGSEAWSWMQPDKM